MPPIGGNTPFSTDYRGLLVAKVTAMHEPASGPLTGRRVYEWTEHVISAAGGDEEPAQARRGVYTSATVFDNVMLDANDAELTIDAYVWARMKGVVGGATVYETVTPSATVEQTDPTACRDTLAGLLETDRLTFTVSAGAGRCANIDAATLTGWRPDPDVEEWVSVGTFPTAIGDTTLTFAFADDDGDPVVTLSALDGEDAEGSGGAVVTKALTVVGCAAGCLDYAIRPLTWCDSDPVTGCDELPDGAPRRYRVTAAGGTGDYADLNGEWTAAWDAGCEWLIADAGDGVTGSVGWYPAAGMTPRRQLVNLTYPGGITAALLSADADSTDGCGTKTGTLDVDLPGDGSGVTGTAPTLTVTAVGPCADSRCGDNTARVRVCCKAHTTYDCVDAIPEYTGAFCLTTTNGNTGEVLGGELTVMPVQHDNSVAAKTFLFRCDAGTSGADDPTLVRCGWDIVQGVETVGGALDEGGILDANPAASLIRVIVYYEPTADGGAGAWVMQRVTVCNVDGADNDCCFVSPSPAGGDYLVAANDPDPADDPWEVIFRWETSLGSGVYHEMRISQGPCSDTPADPVCDAPECPDGAAEEYTDTLSGGTGDYAVLNGGWTYTHVYGDVWVGVLGGATATIDIPTGKVVYDIPGVGVASYAWGGFTCCGTTALTFSDGDGTGTPPTATDLTPVGDCECP